MTFLRAWLLRPTMVTSGVAILLVAIAGIMSPAHHAAASPQSAFGAATVLGGGKTAVVAVATPKPTPTVPPTQPPIVVVPPTSVPTIQPYVLPPTPTAVPYVPPAQSTPHPTPPPTIAPPTIAPPTPTATPAPPTATPTPQAGVLQMSPTGFTLISCTTGQFQPMALQNVGKQSLTWTASLSSSDTATSSMRLSQTSGTLAAGASTTLRVSGFIRSIPGSLTSFTVTTAYTSAGATHAGYQLTQVCA